MSNLSWKHRVRLALVEQGNLTQACDSQSDSGNSETFELLLDMLKELDGETAARDIGMQAGAVDNMYYMNEEDVCKYGEDGPQGDEFQPSCCQCTQCQRQTERFYNDHPELNPEEKENDE